MNIFCHQLGAPKPEKMVFLHGFLGSGGDFSRLMGLLSSDYACYAPDLPGHGCSLFKDSDVDEGLASMGDVAHLILEELSLQGVEEFVLYGYSMGGRIAQAMCLQAPTRIRHLFLESASFGIQDENDRKERYRKDGSLLEGLKTQADFRRFLEKWHRLPLFSTLAQSPLLEDLIVSKQGNDIRQLELALTLLSVGNQPWFATALNRIDVPISYFYGEQDHKYRSMAHDARKHIPRLTLKGFADASHNIHLQYLPEIVSALRDILA